jgi:hypothetical protein
LRVDERVRVAVDGTRVRTFDAVTGARLDASATPLETAG